MKIDKAVVAETVHIAIGAACGAVLVNAVYLVIGKFDYTVALGSLLGGVFAVLNFFLLGLCVQKAVGMGERAQMYIRATYGGRMLLTAVVLIVGFTVPVFNWIAVAVPLLTPRLTILFLQIIGKYKPE